MFMEDTATYKLGWVHPNTVKRGRKYPHVLKYEDSDESDEEVRKCFQTHSKEC